jgi:hypothetical protein
MSSFHLTVPSLTQTTATLGSTLLSLSQAWESAGVRVGALRKTKS